MNTSQITGRAAAVYGVGPTAVRPPREVAAQVGAFVLAVRTAAIDPAAPSGGTYGLTGTRYVVGGYAPSVVLPRGVTGPDAVAHAVAFAAANPGADFDPILGDAIGLGFWRDASTGRIWLDAVRGFDDLTDATAAARANGELAIYDAEAEREIRL